MKYLKNIQYISRHKWHVLLECFKAGIYWRGIMHDMSKFLPSEFLPYSEHFYGNKGPNNRHNQFYIPGSDKEFDKAWLKYIHRNKHHWQYWILRQDDGINITCRMPEKYAKEMICDWNGAGIAQGFGNNTKEWYIKNKNNIILHPITQEWVEKQLKI